MSHVQPTTPADSVPSVVWTIVVAGGSGRRFGAMKQFESIDERRVLDHSVAVALENSNGVVVVVPKDDVADETTNHRMVPQVRVVAGGPTRTASVRHGLAAVPMDASVILVHDAARPFASSDLYRSVILAIRSGSDGAVPGLPVVDTIKVIEVGHVALVDAVVPRVVETPDRATLVAVQTPQAFRADILRRAYVPEIDGTDDSSLVETIGGTVIVVPGEPHNRKITHPEDLLWAREFLANGRA